VRKTAFCCYGILIDQLALKISDWLLLSVKVIAHARFSRTACTANDRGLFVGVDELSRE